MAFVIKRIYEEPEEKDGYRVLIDRLWARGLKKEDAAVDLWLKEIAPSTELRKWFGHDPERWEEFQERYRVELDGNPEPVEKLVKLGKRQRVTLLFSARGECHHGLFLLRYLKEMK